MTPESDGLINYFPRQVAKKTCHFSTGVHKCRIFHRFLHISPRNLFSYFLMRTSSSSGTVTAFWPNWISSSLSLFHQKTTADLAFEKLRIHYLGRQTMSRTLVTTDHVSTPPLESFHVTFSYFLTLYAPCIILKYMYVYEPTRYTNFLWLDFIFH